MYFLLRFTFLLYLFSLVINIYVYWVDNENENHTFKVTNTTDITKSEK